MRNIHKIILPTILFMWAIIQLKAQGLESINIIPNGGFEKWKDTEQPIGWRIVSDIPEQIQEKHPGGTGAYALKIWLNGGSIFMAQPVSVKAGKQYTFSFWYKGNIANNEIVVTSLWYEDGRIKSRGKILSVRTVKDEWKKAEGVVTIPENIYIMGMGIKARKAYEGYLLLDDVSMTLKEGEKPNISPSPATPENLRIKAFQREMEISWNKATDPKIKWEVVVDGKVETVISENSYVKTKLNPGSEHLIKVRAINGKEYSQYAELKGVTEKMSKTENSEDRIPYLRTITTDGKCEGRFLKLYFNELANPNAKISYKLNGVAVQPKDNILEFPNFEGFYKQFQLEIYIDEGDGREWEILYPQLAVIKNEE